MSPNTGYRIALIVLLPALALLTGCEQDYSQESPEALVDSARQMVVDGNARRLSELVWTESDGEALVIDRLGRTFGALQRLGTAVSEAFPEEVNKIREQADEAAENGQINSLIGRALTAQGGIARGAPSAIRDEARMRQGLDSVVRELMADPYGWLERHGEKLEPMRITDDIVALSWQGKPVVGLSLVEHDGLWYVKLPLDMPALKRFLPQNDEEFEIWGELVASVHNVLLDLAIEVENGEHKNLESVASTAGEYALPTAFMVMIAYGKALEERGSGDG
ncbi:MAG: hypothetical protein NCW75_06510 [Phycisphaera sp.]|nr:MAG: hypothetical protein NCW75_06510 [Phycisphaera sp.]